MCLNYDHLVYAFYLIFFFFKQKTAYEMRISDWSSDVCSSDLGARPGDGEPSAAEGQFPHRQRRRRSMPGAERDRRPRSANDVRSRMDAGEIGSASCRERVCQ